jgi:hypothetical protein
MRFRTNGQAKAGPGPVDRHTLSSTNLVGSATSRTVPSVTWVGPFGGRFSQATQKAQFCAKPGPYFIEADL